MRWLFFAAMSTVVIGWLPESALAAPPPVFFQELMWAGTDRSTADEWLTLGTTSSVVVDLAGWKITVLTPKGEVDLVVLTDLELAPQGSLLIASHNQHHQFSKGESALAIDPDLIVSSLSLSNATLQFKLYQPSGNSWTLVDTAGSGKTPLAGSTKPPTAMERKSSLGSGDLAASWQSATTTRNLDAGSLTLATPDHAGRPTVVSPSIAPLVADRVNRVEVAVDDPDGDDNIQSVILACDGSSYSLNDRGISLDRLAGDQVYSTYFPASIEPSACVATTTDVSGLSHARSYRLQTLVVNAPIRLSEALPDPTDEQGEEFIELVNEGVKAVDLSGWWLDDDPAGGGKPFSLTGTTLSPGEFRSLPLGTTKLGLNNDDDQLVLTDPLGSVIDRVAISGVKVGQAWARRDTTWEWTAQPTPGAPNIFPVRPTIASGEMVVDRSIATFAARPAEDVSRLHGWVVAVPGMLSSRYGVIADETGAAEVYLASGSFPFPALDTWVTVTGRRSAVSAARLLIRGAADVVVAVGQPPRPVSLDSALGTIQSSAAYVMGSVEVIRVNSRSVTTALAGQSISVVWPENATSFEFPEYVETGAAITVTGILRKSSSGVLTLTLRSPNDLKFMAAPAPVITVTGSASASESTPTEPLAEQPRRATLPKAPADVVQSIVLPVASLASQVIRARLALQLAEIIVGLRTFEAHRSTHRNELTLQVGTVALVEASLVLFSLLGWGEWRRWLQFSPERVMKGDG